MTGRGTACSKAGMLTKLLLTVAVILAVLYGAKAIQSLTRGGKDDHDDGETGGGDRAGPPARREASELESCRVCGTYVAKGRPVACEREDCPYKD